MAMITLLLQASMALHLAPALPPPRHNIPTQRVSPLQMSLRMPEDSTTIDALIEQTRNSNAVVVLHFCDPSGGGASSQGSSWDTPSWEDTGSSFGMPSLSGAIVARVAETYSMSNLYGGAPLCVLQIDADVPGMDLICAQRGIMDFPVLQVWQRGMCEEVVAGDLEAKLLSLGVASQSKKFDGRITGTATFETDLGTGKPSATAVDEIDFTGGRALGTTRGGQRGVPNSGAKGTWDFFPGRNLDEKPGDNMNKDGTPGSKPRDDTPFGEI